MAAISNSKQLFEYAIHLNAFPFYLYLTMVVGKNCRGIRKTGKTTHPSKLGFLLANDGDSALYVRTICIQYVCGPDLRTDLRDSPHYVSTLKCIIVH